MSGDVEEAGIRLGQPENLGLDGGMAGAVPLRILPLSTLKYVTGVALLEFSSRCQRFMNISALSACSDCHGYWCRRFWCRPFRNATPALHRYNSPFQDCYRLSCFKNITAVTASRMNVSGSTALTLLPVVRSKAIITVALIPQYFLSASGMLPLRRLQARCRCQTLSPLVRGYRCYRYHRFKILPLYLCVVLCCYAHHSFELADIVAALSITNVTASRL